MKFTILGGRIFCLALITYAALHLSGCGAAHTLKPLGEGKSQIDLSVGGPLITMGFPIPVPYTVLGYDYGISKKINVFGSFHPTAAVYKTIVIDGGGTFEIFAEVGALPEIVIEAEAVLGSNFKTAILFPIITPIASYQLGRYSPYLGINNLFEFSQNDRIYTPQSIAPFLGLRAHLGSHWQAGAEVKWTAINHDLSYDNIEHPSAFGTHQGDLAPYLFVSYGL